jgi:hypothetical protein
MADYTANTYTRAALPAWAEDPSKFKAETLTSMAGGMQGATSYSPSDNALVSKQLTTLLSQDSPWITAARARTSQYANRRGLLNSSIAAGEGEKAATEAALPVASADANAFFTAQRDNASAANTFARDANAFSREGALSALRAGYDMASADRGYSFQAGESAAERGLRSDIAARTEGLQRDELGLKREQLGTDTRLRERELTRLEAAGATDVELRRADAALRERGLDTDTRLREADMSLRGQTLDRETALRERELRRLEAAGATDAELRRADMALRERSLTSEIGLKQDELGLRQEDLALRRESEARTATGREAELLQQMQRTYLDARTSLETSQGLDADAKARAIDGLNAWYEKTALPTLRASLGSPDKWPDFGAPAPRPTAPQPPVSETGPFPPPGYGAGPPPEPVMSGDGGSDNDAANWWDRYARGGGR